MPDDLNEHEKREERRILADFLNPPTGNYPYPVPGEFHWRDGIYFKRRHDGAVVMRRYIGRDGAAEHWQETVIPPLEWCSIVAHVAATSGTAESYGKARALHGSTEA